MLCQQQQLREALSSCVGRGRRHTGRAGCRESCMSPVALPHILADAPNLHGKSQGWSWHLCFTLRACFYLAGSVKIAEFYRDTHTLSARFAVWKPLEEGGVSRQRRGPVRGGSPPPG